MSENLETGNVPVVNDEVAEAKRILDEYNKRQKESKSNNVGRLSGDELKKKMFNTRESEEIFRILPVPRGREFFEEAYFHNVEVTVNGSGKKQWSKVYCPKHNDPPVPLLDDAGHPVMDHAGNPILVPAKCPLCDKHEAILKTQTKTYFKKDQELTKEQKDLKDKNAKIFSEANKYKAELYFIVKGIDRGQQKDGVKFWRYKKSYNGQGVDEKLKTCYTNYLNRKQKVYHSPVEGCDVYINVIDAKMPNGTTYKSVTAIEAAEPSKLHEDQNVVNSWINDPITWREVYRPKIAPNTNAFQYLEMIATGTEPYWDDTNPNNKHWVFPGRPDLEKLANTRDASYDQEPPQPQAVDLTNGVTDMGTTTFTSTPVAPVVQPSSTYTGQVILEEKQNPIVVDTDDLPF